MGLRADFLQAGLATGEPVRADTADLVLEAGLWLTGRAAESWTADDLLALAWYGVLAWCRTTGSTVPGDAGSIVQRLAEHLDPTGEQGLASAVREVVDPVAVSARRNSRRSTRSARSA